MESKGLGDTIEKITTATGIKKVVEFTSRLQGGGCVSCKERREFLNRKFPYK